MTLISTTPLLPLVAIDGDFLDYLRQEGIDDSVDIHECAIYFEEWLKENT